MTIANSRATRRHATGWLIALVVAAASLYPGVTGSVHAITEDFYCRADAYTYVLCDPPVVFETTTKATITIQFTNHATGGEVCYIADVNGSQITGPMWVDEGDPDKKTFAYPGGEDFEPGLYSLACKRRAGGGSGDFGMGGNLHHSGA
jgi:hypothetical protein